LCRGGTGGAVDGGRDIGAPPVCVAEEEVDEVEAVEAVEAVEGVEAVEAVVAEVVATVLETGVALNRSLSLGAGTFDAGTTTAFHLLPPCSACCVCCFCCSLGNNVALAASNHKCVSAWLRRQVAGQAGPISSCRHPRTA